MNKIANAPSACFVNMTVLRSAAVEDAVYTAPLAASEGVIMPELNEAAFSSQLLPGRRVRGERGYRRRNPSTRVKPKPRFR